MQNVSLAQGAGAPYAWVCGVGGGGVICEVDAVPQREAVRITVRCTMRVGLRHGCGCAASTMRG
jgi:ribosomal protein L16/L10AE